jgi:hypothetical protein
VPRATRICWVEAVTGLSRNEHKRLTPRYLSFFAACRLSNYGLAAKLAQMSSPPRAAFEAPVWEEVDGLGRSTRAKAVLFGDTDTGSPPSLSPRRFSTFPNTHRNEHKRLTPRYLSFFAACRLSNYGLGAKLAQMSSPPRAAFEAPVWEEVDGLGRSTRAKAVLFGDTDTGSPPSLSPRRFSTFPNTHWP